MIKKVLLNKSKFLTVLVFLLAFSGNVNAQTYTITGPVNSSTLTCATFTGKTIVYIGDGVTDSKLIMNSNLDLTTCSLGSIQLIIRNKGILEFPDKTNNILNLPTGSSIVIESGGEIYTNGSCSNADLIQIGGNSVSSCQGGGMPTFDDVVENGGINEAGILSGNQYICSIPGSATFTSSESGGTFTSGTQSVATVNATSGVITAVAVGQSVITYTKNSKSTTRIVYVGSSFGGTVSGGTTVCSTTNSTTLTLSGYKGAIVRWESSTNNFATATSIANTATSYTVSNLSITTSYRAVIGGTGCNANSTSATIIVGTNLSASVSSQPNCKTPTGTITVTAPANGTGISYTVIGTNPVVAAVTNTTGLFSGLAAGNYNVTTTNATGCTSLPTPLTVNVFLPVNNTWNGVSWSTGFPPTIDQNIVFAEVTTVSSDLVGCSCQVNADVTVVNGANIILTNGITVSKRSNNTFYDMVFESGSSLVQTNNVSNYGDIKYDRDTQSRNSDYTYWSSPVSSLQTLGGIEGLFPDALDGTFYSFDSSINPANWKNESSGTSMTVGKGYIARGPEDSGNQTPPDTQFTTTFIGVPNNGTINVSILHSGALDGTSNLIGNPYPSAINADLFLAANTSVIDGTLYFWTHNTEIGAGTTELGSGLYPYTGNDYASYNGTGGAAGSGGKIPNGAIAAGQGFFTTSKLASGTATFTNDMRLAGTTLSNEIGVNQQFFKTKNPNKSAKTIEKNRIWLNLTNTQGAFKQTLVGYITDATNDYDDRFDGESFDGNEFVDFYSVNQDKNLVIQGRALPFDDADEVPLGFRTTINGAFTINIDQVDGLLTNQAVFLEDKLTNTVFDLKSGNYTFNTVAGTFDDRFVLKYTNKTLGTKTFDSLEKTVLVSNKNKQIKIDSSVEMIDKVTVFDLLGRQIYQKSNVNNNELSISNLVSNRQVVIVKTVLQNGQEVSNKIVY